MNQTLTIRNRQRAHSIDLRLLRGMVRTLLEDLLTVERYGLGVLIVAAREMTRLNQTFLQHAGATDVLTFDYAETSARASRLPDSTRVGNAEGRDARAPLHGEIIVCVDEAVIQARRFRTSWQSELARCVIHGVLHLRGFDDLHAAARLKMKREEDRLLRAISRRFALSKLARQPRLSG